ncbi:aldose epimerase family protein [Streptococcus moroccensis]|uniref:Aldose 1-epimerase n=1 Tax=Streptococcus moroccensis TaxID=1451356 RepID=A0ABT9YS48_9STRE|nr:aldose epimerase family protein [Streptococcus moroccensis]MDQ0222826.1 aldose 1-epimerase [Streptococcus moroccensis]
MTVTVSDFGAEQSKLYRLTSETGVEVALTNFGARIVEFWVPTLDGKRNIVVGYASDEAYRQEDIYIGAMVGPVAGRLSGAEITLGEETFALTANEKGNNLHGGPESLHTAYWDTELLGDSSLAFTTVLADGQNGFPGPIAVKVIYELVGNALTYRVEGVSEKETVFNPTNHVYFNLDGDVTKVIDHHKLKIKANQYAPLKEDNTPAGHLEEVAGTVFDFRDFAPIGQGFHRDDLQHQIAQGYDHAWALDGDAPQVEAKSSDGKVSLTLDTDLPSVVIYTYGWPVADGREIVPHGAFTLETQLLPDALVNPGFGDIALKVGDTFTSTTTFTVTLT